jgi:hypothetical protein
LEQAPVADRKTKELYKFMNGDEAAKILMDIGYIIQEGTNLLEEDVPEYF